MGTSLADVFRQALEAVGEDAARAYEARGALLAEDVTIRIGERADLHALTGRGLHYVMAENHQSHARFMAGMFRLKSVPTFLATVAWVYRSYQARGFSPDYFPVELQAWRDAVAQWLEPEESAPICAFYDVMAARHRDLLALPEPPDLPGPSAAQEAACGDFLSALLRPDIAGAIRTATLAVRDDALNIPAFWEGVIRPALYEVGRLWSNGAITIGQEHMATSVAERTMAAFAPLVLSRPHGGPAVVVAASPGEQHEIGVRVLADVLELRGYGVYYAGANTPSDSIASLLATTGAVCLMLSTTVPSYLRSVPGVIASVREVGARVVVGGQAYRFDPDLWRTVGADSTAGGAAEAAALIDGAASAMG